MSNPFIGMPVTLRRVVFTALSAIVYLLQVPTAILLGIVLFAFGKKTDRKREIYHRYINAIYRLDMKIMPGVKHHIENAHGEDFSKGGIMICNHQSFLDSMCLMILTPKLLIAANDNVWRNVVIRNILKFADFYPMSKGLAEGATHFRKFIDKGYMVVVFPEGERSLNCDILRFHRGAFYLAEELQCDLLPVFIHGVGHVMPKGCAWLNRGKILIEVGKRIPAVGRREYAVLAKEMRHFYNAHYAELRQKIEVSRYFNYCVQGLYLYAGCMAAWQVKRLLGLHDCYSELVDGQFVEDTVIVKGDKYGVVGLLFALVHNDKQVISDDRRGWLSAIRQRSQSFPPNLSIVTNPEVCANSRIVECDS